MKNSELIQMGRLLEKYKEYMCSKYKQKDMLPTDIFFACENCPHCVYEFCKLDEVIQQAKKEIK